MLFNNFISQAEQLIQPINERASRMFDYRRSLYKSGHFEHLFYYYDLQNMIYFAEFDVAKEYLIYFPNGNFTQIIKSMKIKSRIKQGQSLKINKSHAFNKTRIFT